MHVLSTTVAQEKCGSSKAVSQHRQIVRRKFAEVEMAVTKEKWDTLREKGFLEHPFQCGAGGMSTFAAPFSPSAHWTLAHSRRFTASY